MRSEVTAVGCWRCLDCTNFEFGDSNSEDQEDYCARSYSCISLRKYIAVKAHIFGFGTPLRQTPEACQADCHATAQIKALTHRIWLCAISLDLHQFGAGRREPWTIIDLLGHNQGSYGFLWPSQHNQRSMISPAPALVSFNLHCTLVA